MNMRCDEKGLVKIWNLSWFKIQWNSHFASTMGTRSLRSFFIFGKLTVLQRVKSHQVQVLKHVGVAKKEKPVFNGLWDSTAWHAQQSQVKAEVHFDSVNVGVEFTVHNPHELKKIYIYTHRYMTRML